ncbi:MAG: hypothetical protein HYV19_13895 [Gemmatimonadetes bacterium]|nr:hypothetical protein [Gemmatimonadota bacterium]
MTDTERFEQFLRETAADYQAPSGEVPREEMWNAIRARRTAAPAPVPSIGTAPSRRRPWYLAAAAMAAMLLIGVAIGRFSTTNGSEQQVVAQSVPTTVPNGEATPLSDPTTTTPSPASSASPNVQSRARRDDGATLAGARRTTYGIVATRHLASVEALLASYQANATEARSDTLLGAWAKSLLSNTRMLIDSPVADDPVRARLLSDLELILVQLVQRTPGADAESRAAVDRTLQKTHIIPRLRSAVPASLLSGTD